MGVSTFMYLVTGGALLAQECAGCRKSARGILKRRGGLLGHVVKKALERKLKKKKGGSGKELLPRLGYIW